MSNKQELLGQVFTPDNIVELMISLIKNNGAILEPSAGLGAFSNKLGNITSIEIDSDICNKDFLNINFFDYNLENKFDTIIGNPPYISYLNIDKQLKTKLKMQTKLLDGRSNIYLHFIEKCIKHLNTNGELIFIIPRDFLKATSSIKLNKWLYEQGTITNFIDLGDKKIFKNASPNTVIIRFEKDNFSKICNDNLKFIEENGQLLFLKNDYTVKFSDLFFVKVGAVSGNDEIYTNELGNEEFVCSTTRKTGLTRRMFFNIKNEFLESKKLILLNRKVKIFNESNWWQWGRNHYISSDKRIYVNAKTRQENPFFIHSCNNYDGSILAIFLKNQDLNLEEVCKDLNEVQWGELGFMCENRYLFSQKSLENSVLPDSFKKYL